MYRICYYFDGTDFYCFQTDDENTCINIGKGGIEEEWNFGLKKATERVVTIAYQDDIYEAYFAWKVLENINKHKKPLTAFTDYGDLRNGARVTDNRLLNVSVLCYFRLKAESYKR